MIRYLHVTTQLVDQDRLLERRFARSCWIVQQSVNQGDLLSTYLNYKKHGNSGECSGIFADTSFSHRVTMRGKVKVAEVDFNECLDEIRLVRFTVFVDEQRVPPEMEMDEWDERSRHVLATVGDRVVGTGRLLPDGHIGRVAVLQAFRGKGVGQLLMEELMRMGKSSGMTKFVLSAQTQATVFYERLGFVVCGSVYEEAGIPHVEMYYQT